MLFDFDLFCFLSNEVKSKQTKWKIKSMIGVPKTAKTFPLNPSALPSAPQWVVIMSGKSFHIMIPNKAGSKIIIDDIITLILFFLSIIIIPFQICNP